MNSQVFNFRIIPSVVKADAETTITIRPLGKNVAFHAGETYTVQIRAVETACDDFRELPTAEYAVTPNEQGDLQVTHLFAGEQKHIVYVIRPESDLSSPYRDVTYRPKYGQNTNATLAVYSLYPDLYGMRCYKGEVHCHTYASDGIEDIPHTVANYRAAGYDFLAITDHYISYGSEQAKALFDHTALPMTLFLGEEVHVPQERIHAVHLGGKASVNAYYREHPQEVKAQVEELMATLDLPENVSKINYAWQKWSADKSREMGGLAILAHPHWVWNDVYFMAESVTRQLLCDGVYDALDLRDTEVDTSLALWQDVCLQGHTIPVVGSTDAHYTAPYDPKVPAKGGYTLVFAPDRSEQKLMDAIRENRSLCVSTDHTPEFVMGPYRLVKLGRFMLDYFFPYHMWLSAGFGPLVSEYSPDKEPMMETLAEQSEAFMKEFYGY